MNKRILIGIIVTILGVFFVLFPVQAHKEDHERIIHPTATPIPSCSPTPTITPTLTPDPIATPSATPTQEPKQDICSGTDANGHACGWSPDPYRSPEYKPSVCSVPVPHQPTLQYHRKSDTVVTLSWDETDENTTHWGISYGLSPDHLLFGIPFLDKNVRSVDISGLTAANWWFQLIRYNTGDCASYSPIIDP